jgi:hypothetical protein
LIEAVRIELEKISGSCAPERCEVDPAFLFLIIDSRRVLQIDRLGSFTICLEGWFAEVMVEMRCLSMKKIYAVGLILILGFVAESLAKDLSAQKVIDRYRKAAGGKALNRIKSTAMTGRVKTAEGIEGNFSLRASAPDRLRIDIEVADFKVSECYNGKSAWRVDWRGLRTMLGVEAKRLRLESLIANTRLSELSRNRVILKPSSKINIEGRDLYLIELTKDDASVKLFFDAASWLLVRKEKESSEGKEEISLSDYRAVDGVMEPHSLRIKNGAKEFFVSIDRIDHNSVAEETAFHYPRIEGSKPLPDVETLLKAIYANQERIEELIDQYTFRSTEIERKLDGNGKVKETETRAYEVTTVSGREVRRLISVNGKELSAQEKEKEDRRIQKEVEQIIKEREKELAKKEKSGGEEKSEDGITILDIIRISEITSVRREVFRGYEVIAFDYEPRKGFKPKSRIENLASKLAGTIWVDEKAQQIVRLEARLIDSFKIGGGLLASVSPSTAIVFEQEKIGNEVWLPSYADMNFSARIMLFAKFNRSFERRYSDYRKVQVDSTYQISNPKENKKPEGKP